jgi:hypothetical protein
VKESQRLREFLQILGREVKRIFAGGRQWLSDDLAERRLSGGSLSPQIGSWTKKLDSGFRRNDGGRDWVASQELI